VALWLAVVRNTPRVEEGRGWEEMPLRSLCKRISFSRTTNYGDFFEVFNKPDAANVAYTNCWLPMHTDMPSYKNCPEIQLLHCIKQATEGGSSFLTDGFKVAEYIHDQHPEIFDLLTNIPLDYREYGYDGHVGFFDLTTKHSVLQLDPVTRKMEKVCWSNHQRASKMDIPLNRVKDTYRALKKWDELLHDRRFMIKHRLREGDILCFGNSRVLHGREAFVVNGDDVRWLQGTYLEWDEFSSRHRSVRPVYGREWDDVI